MLVPSPLPEFPTPIIDFVPGLWSSLLITPEATFTTQISDDSPLTPIKLPFEENHPPSFTTAAIGRNFSLLLSATGNLYSVGTGAFGELGLGHRTQVSVPTKIDSLIRFKIVDVAAAEFHWLAVDATGGVFSCGNNSSGQLGLAHSESVNIPSRVTALWPHPIVSVSTGDAHSAALSADGHLFCFGSNKYGQLGNASFQIRVASLSPALVPVPVCKFRREKPIFNEPADQLSLESKVFNTQGGSKVLLPEMFGSPSVTQVQHSFFVDVACGSAHTLALRNDGTLLCWGKGENGQLGIGLARALYEPTAINLDENFVSVSAGERHSGALTVEGRVFMWGDGSTGQLGNNSSRDEHAPVEISSPYLITESERKRFLQLKCGGYHTLALIGDESTPVHVPFNEYLKRIPLCNVDNMLQPKAGLSRFGSANVLLHTFLRRNEHHLSPSKVDYIGAETAHVKFCRIFGDEGVRILRIAAARIRHQAQVAFGLVQARDRERVAFDDEIKDYGLITPKGLFEKDDHSFRSSVANAAQCGYLFFIALMNPIYGESKCITELAELAAILLRCEDNARDAFLETISHCEEAVLSNRLVRPLQNVLTDELRGYRRITRNAIFATKLLALCFHGVWRMSRRKQRRGLCVSRKLFCNETVSEMVNFAEDYDRWVNNRKARTSGGQPATEIFQWNSSINRDFSATDLARLPPLPQVDRDEGPFAFCSYSFLLTEEAKFKILEIESQKTMTKESMRSLLSLGVAQTPFGRLQAQLHIPAEHLAQLQFLVLCVRRSNIVSDTYDQIAHYAQNQARELRKPLKVIFNGEEGVDEGGVSKDFYQVLLERILSPDYGMFEYDEETRLHWFRKEFLEPDGSWQLIGIIFGLAAFNSILLDVQFPPVIYRKLEVAVQNAQMVRTSFDADRDFNQMEDLNQEKDLEYRAGLDDVCETFPTIGNSLRQLQDYNGDDVEDLFNLTFEITYPGLFGKVETVELVENGGQRAVTHWNRGEFIERYVDFLINSSIERAFRPFALGFLFMLNGPFVNELTANDLETLVVGEKELDFAGLRQAAQYEGYNDESPIILHLWQVLDEYNENLKRQFLAFVTGTDRAPIGGLGKLKIIIQREGPDNDRLPTSRTCFNVLLLPEYGSRAKLRNRLTTAVSNCKGFGLE